MITHKYITDYIDSWRNGEILLNQERILMIEWLEQDILTRSDIYFDEDQIEKCIAFGEKWYFNFEPFQKLIICFIFLKYEDDDSLVFDEFFLFMARGAGKNGFMSAIIHYLIGEEHGIPLYNVAVVANSEKQAKTSFVEIYNAVDLNDPLKGEFKHRKQLIESNKTKAVFEYFTSNAATKDGLRPGAILYDEVHEYENNEIIDVFSGGLGKVPDAREFFIGTDGFLRDCFIDRLKDRAMNILTREVSVEEDSLFPFMCKLDEEDQMNDPNNWQLANPQFHPPMSAYAKTLFKKVNKQYLKLENDPSGYENFITKRMNLPKIDLEKNVTSWEKIEATDQPYDLEALKKRECVGVLDYASIRDFSAVGLIFHQGEKFIFPKELTQSYVCKPFADKHYAYSQRKGEGANKKDHRKFAPIRQWENEGLLTVVNNESMNPNLIIEWFVARRNEGYLIKKVIGDSFRMELLKPLLEAEGFVVETIRNPDAASALLSPKIELAFDKGNIVFGDNSLMRWYTNNILVVIDNRGNKLYRKKEKVKRKTDGFMAFVYGVWACRDLDNSTGTINSIHSLKF